MLSAIQQVWSKLYSDAGKRAQEASDPALKKHFEAEQKQIKLTLDAMDIQDPSAGYGGDIDSSPARQPAVVSAKSTGQAKSVSAVSSGNATPPAVAGGSTLGPGFPQAGEPYREAIEEASKKSGVPANLLAALIHDESRWQPNAGTVNGGNGLSDSGLVQMNSNTFADLQTRHPDLVGKNKDDPATNILAGAYYLAEMKDEMKKKYGKDDWGLALRAYNSGPNGVDPNNLSNLPAGTGTSNYVDKVMSYARIIESGGQLPA